MDGRAATERTSLGKLKGKQVSRNWLGKLWSESDVNRYWEAKLAAGHVPSDG